jgi:hypothetical protein
MCAPCRLDQRARACSCSWMGSGLVLGRVVVRACQRRAHGARASGSGTGRSHRSAGGAGWLRTRPRCRPPSCRRLRESRACRARAGHLGGQHHLLAHAGFLANQLPMMVSVAPKVSARAGTEYISAVSMKLTPRASERSQDGVGGGLVDLLAKGHGAQADGGDMQVALTQLDGVHRWYRLEFQGWWASGRPVYGLRREPAVAGFSVRVAPRPPPPAAQHAPLHLAGGGHGQGVDELDLLGVLVGRQLAAHVACSSATNSASNWASHRRMRTAAIKIRSKTHIGLDHGAALGGRAWAPRPRWPRPGA